MHNEVGTCAEILPIQLRFIITASAVVVRIFWRRLPSFKVFWSFCSQQFEIHNAWLNAFISLFNSGVL